MLKSTEDTLKEYLSPEQVGVAIPNATETTARRVRLWLQHAGPNHMMLQVDMKNAFGSVFRDRMLSELRAHCPALYPYAAACYRIPNLLMGDGYTINSSRGVQRGDVCGPALFAIALHPVILRLREVGLDLNIWYLDDGVLCGKVESVATALNLIRHRLPEVGLELNISKCKIFGPAAGVNEPAFDGIPRIPMTEGTILLGVPIGSDSSIEDVCTKIETLLSKVSLLKSNVSKFLLLRACLGACKVNHLLHAVRETGAKIFPAFPSCNERHFGFGPT